MTAVPVQVAAVYGGPESVGFDASRDQPYPGVPAELKEKAHD